MRILVLALISAFSLIPFSASSASYQQTNGTIVDPIMRMWLNPGVHQYSGNDLEPGADVRGADLTYADLANADLRGADLTGAHLYSAILSGVDLSDANLTRLKGINIVGIPAALPTGFTFVEDRTHDSTNGWIIGPTVDLSSTTLYWVDLDGLNLSGADLRFAGLGDQDLAGTILSGADLRGAYLGWAEFVNTDLSGADLRGANLTSAEGLGSVLGTPLYDAETNFHSAWADYRSTPFDPVAAGWTFVPEPSTALLIGLGLAGMAAREKSRCA